MLSFDECEPKRPPREQNEPLADLDARVQQAGTTGDRFLGQVYADLKAGK